MELNNKNWQNLLNYYIAAMQRESDEKISFTQSGRNIKFYTPFKKEELYSTIEGRTIIELPASTPLRSMIERLSIGNNTGHWYYGYPIFRQPKKSQYNDGFYSSLSPILYSEIKLTIYNNKLIIELLENSKNLNPSIFKAAELPFPEIEEFDAFITDFIEREERKGDIRYSITETCRALIKLTGFPSYSEVNINHLSQQLPGNNDPRNLILNNAMIFYSDLNHYMISVIRELEELKKDKHFNKLKETSLYPVLTRKIDFNKNSQNNPTLLIAESNNSQFNALNEALSNRVTVVSGPPGTGKSQVVLNLISSLINNGKAGFLVSKTNAAVDIICEYYNNKFEIPIILRTGNKENRIRTVELIENIAKKIFNENISNSEVNNLKQNYFKQFEEIYKRDLILHKKYEIADQMVILTEKYQALKSQLPEEIINWAIDREISPSECNDKLDLCSEFINNVNDLLSLNERGLLGWLWGNIVRLFRGRNRTAIISKMNGFITDLNIPLTSLSNDSNLELIKDKLFLIKDTLSFFYTKSKLNELQSAVEALPDEKSIVEKFERNEKETIEAARKYLKILQLKKYSEISNEAINQLEDFVRAQNELNGEGRVSRDRFMEMKGIEIRTFPYINHLFPVWVTTSPSARNSMFPLGDNIFDLLIIDEASQCDFPSMIPLLYRAKNVCVIGDINQLPNIVTIDGNTDKSIANNCGISDADHFDFGYRNHSMYQIAKKALNRDVVKLDEHYRSHPDIINFSNNNFYGRFLKIYTNPKSLAVDTEGTAMEWIDVKGEVTIPNIGSAYNEPEAKKVFELVLSLMKRYWAENCYVSFGIVTPLRAQVEFLKKHFFKRIKELPEEEESIYLSYTQGQVPFYIDTVYKFQGNERDVLIFSPVASDGMRQGTYNFINERRQLNVAITRARAKLYIVGDKEYCKNNKGLLGTLAQYTDELILRSTQNEDYENRIQSPIELKFYNKLKSAGYDPIPQYSDEGFNIDFAIIKDEKRMAIEINGVSFHQATDGNVRKDDIIRKRRLINAGWEVKIFWSWDIMRNLDKCVQEIKEYFSN